ncbi:MAG: TonB-dependent receptor [Bacteroidota bacterium]
MTKYIFIILFLLPLTTHIGFAQVNGILGGTITDSRTKEPLVGATVFLEGTTIGASTDQDGRYLIPNIPAGTYNLRTSYIGYKTRVKYNIVIRSEGNIDINFELEEDISQLGEVVVKPNPFEKLSTTPLSVQRLSQEEIVSYPGGNNDIAQVVQTLPGVGGSVGGFRNDVIIRGGAPNENVYYLDGIEIPNINHFATQGSAGGPVSLLNVSFIEGVTLSSSSFGAEYDNVLSGVLQFDQRTGNSRSFTNNIRISSSEAAYTVEGPLFKGDKESSNTTIIASVRRSYLQLLFDALDLPILPDYWDYQYKMNHRIDAYNDIYLTGIGSVDDFEVNELDEFDAAQQAVQDQVPVIQQRTNTVGLGWTRRFKDNSGSLRTTISNNILTNRFRQFEDNINQNGILFDNDSREIETRFRTNLTKFYGAWTTNLGLVFINSDYTNTTNDVVNNRRFNADLNFYRYGIFAQASRKVWKERANLSLGIRADGNSFTDTGNELYRTISPRASFSYKLTPNGDWTWNSSVGRYFKIPPYTTLGFQDLNGTFVNRNNEYIQSDHLVTGLEYLINERSRITVEGFFKWYNNYPVSINDNISIANKGGGFEVLGSEPVSSSGNGRTYGGEVLFQQKFNGRFYAIASLTVYHSEFTNGSEQFVPAVWDNEVLVSLLGGYKFGKNWEVSGRWRYLGPAPFAPVDQQETLANYPAVILDFDRLGDDRIDPFSQVDIRIDKKWSFPNFSFDVFLDIQNVLAQAQPEPPQFGLRRDDAGTVLSPEQLVQVNTNPEGTPLPSLGFVLNF